MFPVLPRITRPAADISIGSLKNIPSPSQNMVVWVKDFYSPGNGRLKLTYDPAGNATYPWRVDDISNGGTAQSGVGYGNPPYAGWHQEVVDSRMTLPCPGIWNISWYDPTWNGEGGGGANVYPEWSSDGTPASGFNSPDANAIMIQPGVWSPGTWYQVTLPAMINITPYSELGAYKTASGSGGFNNGYWKAYPSRIIAP